MRQIELYDILTLEDEIDYTVINLIKRDSKTYYLIAEVDEDENANLDNLRILEDNQDGTLSEILDNKLLESLKKDFIENLEI